MSYVDYTHPEKIPSMRLEVDRRSSSFYTPLKDLPWDHKYAAPSWHLFRYPEWASAGAAWVHALAIKEDLQAVANKLDRPIESFRPLIGSGEPDYDEALAQMLLAEGVSPLVVELVPRLN